MKDRRGLVGRTLLLAVARHETPALLTGRCGALPAIDAVRERAAFDDGGRAARTLPAIVAGQQRP
jgi:hypothetical protein